ncbi:sugar phosphate isomerase/epimerase family protein [Aquisediminimonas profunda]|uniref:sugar phosphate isomerase/epimerase family protein n=1 Tax=Aquisediminimonas profunda TaxID=1550733 RepID=UPI001C62B3BF|nr:sugar phosphate isomerase/epimerase [Aquisediminimonas profunda]
MNQWSRRTVVAGFVALAGSTQLTGKGHERAIFNRGKAPIGLQLYTLGDEWVKDTPGVFGELARIGIRELELPGLMGKTPADLRAEADRAGLRFTSFHLPAMPLFDPNGLSLQSSAAQIADALGILGTTDVVVPLPPLPADFQFVPGKTGPADLAAAVASGGADAWKRFASLLNEKAAALTSHGVTLGYHNHNVEFSSVGNTTPWAILLSETNPDTVFFELDLGWVAAAGLDPAREIRRLGRRVRWVHVKDLKPTTKPNFALQMDPAVVGDGSQDWPAIFRAAESVGVRHYYIEQEPPFSIPRMDAVRNGFRFLSQT